MMTLEVTGDDLKMEGALIRADMHGKETANSLRLIFCLKSLILEVTSLR